MLSSGLRVIVGIALFKQRGQTPLLGNAERFRPVPVLLACLLFGFLEAAGVRLQGIDIPLIGEVPTQLMLALPCFMTVLLLAGYVGKSSPPSAIGEPYQK